MTTPFGTGCSLHKTGNLNDAASAYREVTQDDPDYFKAQTNLGLILEEQRQFREATEAFREAVAAKDDSAALQANLARALHRSGNSADAITCYRRAIELDGDGVDSHYNLAMLHREAGQLYDALAHLHRAAQLAPNDFASHSHLGDVLFDLGQFAEALGVYRRALEIDPSQACAHYDVAKILEVRGRIQEAEAGYRKSLELNPRSGSTYQHLADLLVRQGRVDEARAVIERWLAEWPDHPVARHLMAAITGEAIPERADDEYVSSLFDDFADGFDTTLAKLNYRAPTLVAKALEDALPDEVRKLDILDAGCGTGLCGPLLYSLAGHLAGVDLSRGMIEKAVSRQVYDELVVAELTAFLRGRPQRFDAVVAADTLNYFGSLSDVFRAAFDSLRPGSLFVFTLEHLEPSNQSEWSICPHGRYCHAEAYVHRELGEVGLDVIDMRQDWLRMESGQPVIGWVVTARRPRE